MIGAGSQVAGGTIQASFSPIMQRISDLAGVDLSVGVGFYILYFSAVH